MRSLGSFLVGLSVLFCLGGCGGAQSGGDGVQPIELSAVDALQVTVEEPTLVADVDLSLLRGDELIGELLRHLAEAAANTGEAGAEKSEPAGDDEEESEEPEEPTRRIFRERVFPHLLTNCDRVTFSTRVEEEEEPGEVATDEASDAVAENAGEGEDAEDEFAPETVLFLMECPSDNESLVAMVNELLQYAPEDMEVTTVAADHDGRPVRRLGKAEWYASGGDRWLFGTEGQVVRIVEALREGQAPVPSDLVRILRPAEPQPDRAVWAAFVDDGQEAEGVLGENALAQGIPRGSRAAVTVRLQEQEYGLQLRSLWPDEAGAMHAEESLEGMRTQAASTPLLMFIGLSGPVSAANIEREGAEVRAQIGLPRLVLQGLYNRFMNLRSSRGQGAQMEQVHPSSDNSSAGAL